MQTGSEFEDDWVDLTDGEYDQLRQAAETYRESLVVRLCGEVGLRPPEIARVTPGDFEARATRNGTHRFLTVGGDDESGREAYVPTPVHSAVRRYVNERSLEPDDCLVDVTSRRIQMIVGEVGDRAGELFGEEQLRSVSSQDLCRYYARRLVNREHVDARVVQAVGPWESLDTLQRHLDPIDVDAVLDEFERSGVPGPSTVDPTVEVGRAVASAAFGVLVVGPDGIVEYANEGFEELTDADEAVAGSAAGSLYAGEPPGAPPETAGPTAVPLQRPDGSVVHAVRVATPRDSHGRAESGYVAAFLRRDEANDAGPAQRGQSVSDRVTAAIEVLDAMTAVVADASTRTEVASSVCTHLAGAEAYEFAWVGSVTGDRGVVSTAWDGIDESTAESLSERASNAVESERDYPTTEEGVRVFDGDDELGLLTDETDDWTVDSVALVPVVYGDTTHGLLALGASDDAAFGEEERAVLASLGWQTAQAMTDIERRNLLLADSVTELEFRVESDRSFFVAASEHLGGTFELQGLVPGESQTLLYFVTMRETTPEAVFDFADEVDSVENARLIRDYGDTSLVEFVVGGEEPATTLIELGGHVTAFVAENGAQRITAEFTTETDVRAVFDGLQSPFPESSLFSKQEVQRPVQTTDGFRRSLEDDLTEKQQSVLRAAYLAGYFEWPRGSTAEELADSIGVSSPTLHNHLRKAQQKVLTAFFDDE